MGLRVNLNFGLNFNQIQTIYKFAYDDSDADHLNISNEPNYQPKDRITRGSPEMGSEKMMLWSNPPSETFLETPAGSSSRSETLRIGGGVSRIIKIKFESQ